MSKKKKLTVDCSPISSIIYAGTLLSDLRNWSSGNEDTTVTVVRVVAQYLVQTGVSVEFELAEKKYRLEVKEIELT